MGWACDAADDESVQRRVLTRVWVAGALVLTLIGGCSGPGGAGPSAPSGSSRPTTTVTGTPTAGTNTAGTPTSPGATTSRGTSPTVPSTSRRTTPGPGTSPTTPAAGLRVGHEAWVTVSVATLWRSPSAPRTIDLPALRAPVAIRAWLSAMTVSDRRGLSGRADTQALLGDRVVVIGGSGSWARVVVPAQPTPLDSRGYPGWVPAVQLTATPPVSSSRAATVVSATAWLRTDGGDVQRVVEVSFGTRLPYLSAVGSWVRVGLPGGRALRVRAADVSVVSTGAAALPATGVARVASAEKFLGLPYLWGGTSGFGFDCSGLTHLVMRVHGATIPRDAGPQSRGGRLVAPGALRPGDLLFYAASGSVHHVTMYAGSGRMVHAPRTGGVVEVIPVATPSLAAEFTVARRY